MEQLKKKPAAALGRQLFAEFNLAFDDGDNGLYDFSCFQKQLACRRYFNFPFGNGRNGDKPARDKFEWVKYILFANTDLTQYFDGSPLVSDMTLGFSIVVLAVYFIVFHVLAFGAFTKRDIAS